jgi:hypothetical protein
MDGPGITPYPGVPRLERGPPRQCRPLHPAARDSVTRPQVCKTGRPGRRTAAWAPRARRPCSTLPRAQGHRTAGLFIACTPSGLSISEDGGAAASGVRGPRHGRRKPRHPPIRRRPPASAAPGVHRSPIAQAASQTVRPEVPVARTAEPTQSRRFVLDSVLTYPSCAPKQWR